MAADMIDLIKPFFLDLQNRICSCLVGLDGKAFKEDHWTHKQNQGGGITRILENGLHIEKAGASFSHVHGDALPSAATLKRPELANTPFQALGVSVVVHPRNPYVPTSHFNVRFILVGSIWWFGGGFDLTPYYGFAEDAIHWHTMAKAACDPFGEAIYARYKKACDDYFYLPHRREQRGIGGLFFDDLNTWEFERCFDFAKSVSKHYLLAYEPIFAKRKTHAYGERERDFQCYRRGRYVEYNLLHDRGTLFGIQSGGRTESILMSLPPQVTWRYNWQPEAGTPEAALYTDYLIIREWLSLPLSTPACL